MTPVHARRLFVLAEFLAAFEATRTEYETFDLTVWSNRPEDGDRLPCGTTACACGWATTIPELAAAGFVLNAKGRPSFAGVEGFGAAAAFFGLSRRQTCELFDADSYDDPDEDESGEDATAADVADKIRSLLAVPAEYQS